MNWLPSESAANGAGPAFELLDRRIQEWVWRRGWTDLRDVQEAAIHLLVSSDDDVLITAATAAGKTEAAFLPLCSRSADASLGIRVLYVSPLKALINDQYERLESLCECVGLTLTSWHGDAPSGPKRRLLAEPSGVLLITPESLEAMFVNRGADGVKRLFSVLSAVLVDELHSFLGTERGRQLQSLMSRVETTTGRRVRRIALSATIGDQAGAAEFLRPGAGADVRVLASHETGQDVSLGLYGFVETRPPIGCDPQTGQDLDAPTVAQRRIAEHVFRSLRGKPSLIFANSRRNVERYSDLLGQMCADRTVPLTFLAHHGNLSREVREDVEERLRASTVTDSVGGLSVVCTSTLEMGIDIGAMKAIAQIGQPPSVASLRQRLGRSGRRGENAVLRAYIAEPSLAECIHLQDALRPLTFTTVAMIELMLSGWCERETPHGLHLSTLVQQILSTVCEFGAVHAKQAYVRLCRSGPFRDTDAATFGELLEAMAQRGLISQCDDGSLIIGPVGERITNHFSFYSAFVTADEYRLLAGGRVLGSLPIVQPLSAGSCLIYAGRRWVVESVDQDRKCVELSPASGGNPPQFGGTGSSLDGAIREAMRRLYEGDHTPEYLDPQASHFVAEGRRHYAEYGLGALRLLPSPDGTVIFPWCSDAVAGTLVVLLEANGLQAHGTGFAITVQKVPPAEVVAALGMIAHRPPPDPEALAERVANKATEKYDEFLTPTLLCKEYARRDLALDSTMALLRETDWRAP